MAALRRHLAGPLTAWLAQRRALVEAIERAAEMIRAAKRPLVMLGAAAFGAAAFGAAALAGALAAFGAAAFGAAALAAGFAAGFGAVLVAGLAAAFAARLNSRTFVSDSGDNPGAGGADDVTVALAALLPGLFANLTQQQVPSAGGDTGCSRGEAQLPAGVLVFLRGSKVTLCKR